MSTDRTAEILNYLSAISRDIGAFRAETQTRFDRLESRLKDVETDVREMRGEVRVIASRLDRLDRLEARILESRADARDLEARVVVLEGSQA